MKLCSNLYLKIFATLAFLFAISYQMHASQQNEKLTDWNKSEPDTLVWPGDANNDGIANHYDVLSLGLTFDSTGPARESVSNEWTGHPAEDWPSFHVINEDTINNKHADCDGDGKVSWSDTAAISQNFNHTVDGSASKTYSKDGWNIRFKWEDSKAVGRRKGKVQLGPPSKKKKATASIYSFAFELELTGIEEYIVWSQTDFNYQGEQWFGSPENDLILFVKLDTVENKIYAAFTKVDGENVTFNYKNADGKSNAYFDMAEMDIAMKEGHEEAQAGSKVTSQGGMSADGTPVGINGSIDFDIGDNVELCEGESKTLKAPEGFESYSWNTGADTRTITVDTAGTYEVTVTDSTGISEKDQVSVMVYDNPEIDLTDETIEFYSDTTLDAGMGYDSYVWSTGDISQTTTIDTTGAYWVEVTNIYGCTATDTINTVLLTTGVDQKSEETPVTIYPNPAGETLYVNMKDLAAGAHMQLQLVDQKGARLYKKALGKNPDNRHAIDVSDLASGVYFLQVISNDKVQNARKIIVR